jgi:hypothetical protein
MKKEELLNIQMLKTILDKLKNNATVFVDDTGKEFSIEEAASKGLSGRFVNKKDEIRQQFADLGGPVWYRTWIKLLTELHKNLNDVKSNKGSSGRFVNKKDEIRQQFADLGGPVWYSTWIKLLTELHKNLNDVKSSKGSSGNKRVRYSKNERFNHVENFKTSGLSASQYSKENGIGYATFLKWLK